MQAPRCQVLVSRWCTRSHKSVNTCQGPPWLASAALILLWGRTAAAFSLCLYVPLFACPRSRRRLSCCDFPRLATSHRQLICMRLSGSCRAIFGFEFHPISRPATSSPATAYTHTRARSDDWEAIRSSPPTYAATSKLCVCSFDPLHPDPYCA